MERRPYGLTATEIRDLIGTSPLILEIGANDGEDTVKFLEAMPEAQIWAFEPDPRPCVRFACKDDPRVHFFPYALDETPGIKPFYQSSGQPKGWRGINDKSGSLCKPTGHLDYDPETTFPSIIQVECMRLDDFKFLRLINCVDFIWMDVQGAELRVLRGGQLILAKTRWVLAEVHQKQLYEGQATTAEELLAVMPGFETLTRYGDDILFHNQRFKE